MTVTPRALPGYVHHQISHQLLRAELLSRFRRGLVRREEICDADFLLRAAARHHGQPWGSCPVCERPMALTRWVYGEDLGRRAGSARSEAEIAEFAAEGLSFSVHAVEVCPQCGWNHIVATGEINPNT